ncbi:MAG: phospholipase phosphocholine-specific [Gammaproteobacteria bacterium]|nr:phospholipase phosphocholine-specific [Gammaproteobacteria bacterium]
MSNFNRRDFIRSGAATLSASALSVLPLSIRKALAIPANNITGTIRDVEHVVILMKENRSFDHYFGTLGGVRGFNDKATLPNEGEASIFQQSTGNGGYIEPFRADSDTTNALNMGGLPHGWPDGHAMWNNGRWDRWVQAKGANTMAYFTREDIPFHYALADSFTVCDQYFCSVMGPTNPNRVHLYTGMLDVQASGNGPLLNNTPANGPLTWTTYIERLQQAGVSWRVYQGSDGTEPFRTALTPTVLGDLDYPNPYNTMRAFAQIVNAPADSALAAVSAKRTYAQLIADVQANQLAQVSWLMPAAWCSEHPVYTPADGAMYTAAILDALTSNPEVWSKTVLLIMYDENDGFFDHVVAPTPPATAGGGISNVDTSDELFVSSPHWPGYPPGPVGLGGRVPMLVISPWSKGAWTCSEVFDHTSVIRFLETRFGVREPNITTWRRAICGDLTSAFDFKHPNNVPIAVPSTAGLTAKAAATEGYPPVQPPAVQSMPLQESGARHLRPAPYELFVDAEQDAGGIRLNFVNSGKTAVALQAFAAVAPGSVRDYTVDLGTQLSDNWTLATGVNSGAAYDLTVTAPNGFLRRFTGSSAGAGQEVTARYEGRGDIHLGFENSGHTACTFTITDNSYGESPSTFEVAPGSRLRRVLALEASHSWYDLTVTCSTDAAFMRRFAGHVETGLPSVSDPTLSTGSISR